MSAVLPGAANVSVPRSAGRSRAADRRRPIVEPRLSAAERLEASRARLRTALMAIAHPPPKPSLLDDLEIGSFGSQILERLKALPARGAGDRKHRAMVGGASAARRRRARRRGLAPLRRPDRDARTRSPSSSAASSSAPCSSPPSPGAGCCGRRFSSASCRSSPPTRSSACRWTPGCRCSSSFTRQASCARRRRSAGRRHPACQRNPRPITSQRPLADPPARDSAGLPPWGL